MDDAKIHVEVAYARTDRQWLLSLDVAQGTTIEQALQQSGLLAQCPEIDLQQQKVGVFGKVVPLSTTLRAGDRVEVYRKLIADPKTARRRRVADSDE